jgi:histone-lysine N-methyltransferase SETD3
MIHKHPVTLDQKLDNGRPPLQEEDFKLLQNRELSPRERLALLQRSSEKEILLATTDAVRKLLAPIRGIPTKTGNMEDPNQDILEIFETIEGLPSAPKRLWSSFSRWAQGKEDSDRKR